MSLHIIRPGIRLGNYPHRQADAAITSFSALKRTWQNHGIRKQTDFKSFSSLLDRIENAEQLLQCLDQDALIQDRRRLQTEIRHHGLTKIRAIKLFANIKFTITDQLELTPHPAQLYAAWSMLHGTIVEMNTGEGKTLTASIPAIAVALTGTPVHIITVNEYLVQRDANQLTGLYAQFGLSTATVTNRMSEIERRNAYSANIVYCTNKQIVFDYLRDLQILNGNRSGLKSEMRTLFTNTSEKPLLRGLCFAIVDEADSVLIDDARTPLILAKPRHSDRASITEATIALSMAKSLHPGVDFQLRKDSRVVALTDTGVNALRQLTKKFSGAWKFERYRNERVRQALSALHLYHIDRDYLVRHGQIELIDETTGRVMPDRKLQHGLQRMLELKEKCEVTDENQVISAISFQQFFRRYCHLTGMSGTVFEVRDELKRIYGTRVVRIPMYKVSQRQHLSTVIATDHDEQMKHLIATIVERHATGQPVLIGTRSVSMSECISLALNSEGIEHALLNARQDEQEARIIARAGQVSAITVATNMAGRGTDISLHSAASSLGGLHVINTGVNESGRIDRQLFGRAARQGDPGSAENILSLKDELVVNAISAPVLFFVSRAIKQLPALGRVLAYIIIRYAQRNCERRHAAQRIAVFKGGDRLKRLLAISGDWE